MSIAQIFPYLGRKNLIPVCLISGIGVGSTILLFVLVFGVAKFPGFVLAAIVAAFFSSASFLFKCKHLNAINSGITITAAAVNIAVLFIICTLR